MPILKKTFERSLSPRTGRGCPVLDAAGDAIETFGEGPAVVASRSRRMLFVGLGLICVVLGTVGVFVPGLPTTIFLLGASFFFARSSPRLRNWLWSRPVLGETLRRISRGERAPIRTRVISLISMWIMITITAAFGFRQGASPWILGALLLGGSIGTYYIMLWIPGRHRARRRSWSTGSRSPYVK